MDLNSEDIDPKLVADIKHILQDAPGVAAQQLATSVVCKRVVQFGTKARSLQEFENACKMFGRFDSNALESAYGTIQAHKKHKTTAGLVSSVFGGKQQLSSEVEHQTAATEDQHAASGGGLVYVPKNKRQHTTDGDSGMGASSSAHQTEKTEKGTSALGLDKLAAKLRADAIRSIAEKRAKEPEKASKEEEPRFRTAHIPTHLRQRRADTPSDPGGVSASAQQKLDKHRRRLGNRRIEGSSKGSSYESGRRTRDRRSRSRSRSPRRSRDRSSSRSGDTRLSRDSHERRGTSSQARSRWDAMTPGPRNDDGDSRRASRRTETQGRSSAWDVPTPLHRSSETPLHRPVDTPRWRQSTNIHAGRDNDEGSPSMDRQEWDSAQRQLDRDWYGIDEAGGAADDAHNPFADYVEHDAKLEEKLIGQQAKRMTARQMQYNHDNERWVTNRLMQSGIMQSSGADDEDDDMDKNRVHLLVHDLKPPFLEGTVLTNQLDPVKTVVDPTSDLAVFACKGSALVREIREKRERMKATQDAVNAAGTMLGNVMGIKAGDGADQEASPDEAGASESEPARDASEPSGGSEFSRTRTIREQREYLPAFACREDLLRVIAENQVTVVVGETGSGKTTQLAQYLHEAGYTRTGMVGCTQPRRVAAMSVAKRVAEEMGVTVGAEVGYAIRFEDCTSKQTLLKYMTDGVLLRETLTRRDLSQYSAIIMDEAHERTLNTDVLLGLLKQIVATRRDIKLIVTSATMNSQRFADFFGNAPVFTIPGRTFPVDVMFSKSACEDYVDSAVRQVLTIHLAQASGDILVFMTGQEDIEACCETIRERLAAIDGAKPLAVLPIYSQLPADLQAKIFEASPTRRKV
ncbi:hypothetical protein EV175_005503, partial [Coemansia sp. RSA 1933]